MSEQRKSYLEGGTVLTWADVDRLSGGTRKTLTSFTISEGVIRIGQHAFSNCVSLISVTIPDSVTEISDFAFRNCAHLASVSFPSGLKKIGESAFQDCCGLEEAELPPSLETIGNVAFFRCKKLRKIILPDSIVSIGMHAFTQCDQLELIAADSKPNPYIHAFLDDWKKQRNTVILSSPHHGLKYYPLTQPDEGMEVYHECVNWGKEKPALESIVDVEVTYPFCCTKGDLFVSSFGRKEYIQGRLLEILSIESERAVIRAEIVSTGNWLSFVKRLSRDEIEKLEWQDYKIQPDMTYYSFVSPLDEKKFFELTFVSQFDMTFASVIYTDEDDVDHCVQSYSKYDKIDCICYHDKVIGLHRYCPFMNPRKIKIYKPELPEYDNLLPRYMNPSPRSKKR